MKRRSLPGEGLDGVGVGVERGLGPASAGVPVHVEALNDELDLLGLLVGGVECDR